MKNIKTCTKLFAFSPLVCVIVAIPGNIAAASQHMTLTDKPTVEGNIIAQKQQSPSGKKVGTVQCSAVSTSDSSQNSQKTITKASLSNRSSGGFIFKMRLAGRNDDLVWNVTPDLIVKEAVYAGQDSQMNLQRNGNFSFTYMPTGRKACEIKGTLTFDKGVREKIF